MYASQGFNGTGGRHYDCGDVNHPASNMAFKIFDYGQYSHGLIGFIDIDEHDGTFAILDFSVIAAVADLIQAWLKYIYDASNPYPWGCRRSS